MTGYQIQNKNDRTNAFTDDRIQTVVLMCASQSGKSTIMENVIGRFAHIDPCAIMMIQPTVELAGDFSKSRIAPMIRDTKVLRKLFGDEDCYDGFCSTVIAVHVK